MLLPDYSNVKELLCSSLLHGMWKLEPELKTAGKDVIIHIPRKTSE
jgi:hypothetical protein